MKRDPRKLMPSPMTPPPERLKMSRFRQLAPEHSIREAEVAQNLVVKELRHAGQAFHRLILAARSGLYASGPRRRTEVASPKRRNLSTHPLYETNGARNDSAREDRGCDSRPERGFRRRRIRRHPGLDRATRLQPGLPHRCSRISI